jgi:NTP pyrophosphatase (non-canonical NTP hydrolase)|tara:strand:+ start:23 stop:790 length:768 start_codon:yes stop_codon:yes gene_type:complete
MYYLYHIPGKKIGVTRDLNNRVTLIQGYKPNEYEVLDQSDDIDYISDKEIELQKSYGYKVDRKLYKNLFNKMKINVTEQTSTFPVPLNKLKGRLMDNLDLSWETEHGKLHISLQTIDWIIKNAKTSMFNNERCYVYNKAFARFYDNNDLFKTNTQDNLEIFDKIRSWAKDRGLYEKGDPMTQYVKLQEEAGELAKALLKNDQPEVIDAIGDIVVVLTNLAHQKGLTIEECIATAYEVINKRTGKMINGTFVKDEK